MRRRSIRETGIRLSLTAVGLVLLQLSNALTLLTALGADPFHVFLQGLMRRTGSSYGILYMIASLLLLVVLLFFRSRPQTGSLLCAFFGGWILEGFLRLFAEWIGEELFFPARLLVVFACCLLQAFGMALLIQSGRCGTLPMELFLRHLSVRLQKRPYLVILCCETHSAHFGRYAFRRTVWNRYAAARALIRASDRTFYGGSRTGGEAGRRIRSLVF